MVPKMVIEKSLTKGTRVGRKLFNLNPRVPNFEAKSPLILKQKITNFEATNYKF